MNPTLPDVSNIYANPSGQPAANAVNVSDIYATPQADAETNTAPAPAPAHVGNWLTHLLPTIGSVGGGILGSVFGGGVGGVGGAAGGAGLGKALENALEGQKVVQGNDLTSAVEGGIGQGVGGLAGKALGKAGEYLGSRAVNIVSKDAAQQAIDNRALALKDIAPETQARLNANSSLDHVNNMGYDSTNPLHVKQVADNSNDVLNSILDKALADSGPLDLSHYPQIVKDALAGHSDVLDSFDKVVLSSGRFTTPNTPAAKLLHAMENLGMGKATASADPNEIRTLTTKLGQMAEKYRGVDTPEAKASYAAINEVRNNVKNALYDRPEVNQALQGAEANITGDNGITPQLAEHLNNVISTAGSTGRTPAQDLLSEISRNINVSDLGDEMNRVRQIASSTGGQARLANDAGIQNANTSAVLDAGKAVTGHGGIIPTALAAVSHAKDNPKILATLSRMADLGEKLAPPAGAAIGAANAQISNGTNDMTGGTVPMNQNNIEAAGVTAPPTPAAGTAGLSRNDLITLALYSPSAFNSLVTPSAVNQQNVATANTAEQALSSLGAAPGGGILSQLAGHFGLGPTGEYERKAANVAQQIAAALPGSDAGTIKRELTAYNTGPNSIQQAVAQLMANLQATKQNNTNGAYQSLMNYNPSVINAAGL